MEKNIKTYTGTVVSDKMEKTITVLVESTKIHPIYKKRMKNSKKYKAHDEENVAKMGDFVRIQETKPYSKDKKTKLVEIINKSVE